MPALAVPLLVALLQEPATCVEALRGGSAKAVAVCKAAVGANPQSANAHLELGQAYLATRNVSMVAEAKAEFQQALDLDEKLYWARFYLARVYIDQGLLAKARQELLQVLETRPNVPHVLALLGEVERKLGNFDLALPLLKRALELDPKLNTAHYYAGLVYMDQNRGDEALVELEASVQSQFVAPELYLTLGSLYAQRKRYKEAEAVCLKGIALDPARAEGHLNLAQLYNAQNLSEKALAALKLALPEGKNFTSSPYYQKLLADIHFEYGRAYAFEGNTAKAVDAFEQSLVFELRPETHRRLAQLYEAQGNAAKSREHLAAAAEK